MMRTLLFALLLTSSVAAHAVDSTPTANPESKSVHPLTAEIEALQEATLERLEELETLRNAPLNGEEARLLEREIARTKLDFEIDVLELQQTRQRALGRAKAVGELASAIEILQERRAELADPGSKSPLPIEDRAGEVR